MNNMSYICKKCGNELTDDALFCSRCGEKALKSEADNPATDGQQEQMLQEDVAVSFEEFVPPTTDAEEAEESKVSAKKKITVGKILKELAPWAFWIIVVLLASNYLKDQQIKELNVVIQEAAEEALKPLEQVGVSYSTVIPDYKLPKVVKRSWEEALQADDMASLYYGIGGAFGIAEDIKKGKPVKYYLYQLPVEVYANLNDSGTETLIGKVVVDVTAAFQGWQYFADVRIWTDTQLDSNLQAFITNAEAAREAACVTIDNVWFDEHNGKETIVIAYTWTNTTNSETCAIYNVAIHAYQNNIELENAYFANANNELLQRNVKPGMSVELEEVFYLDNPNTDVLVEATPWITLNGKVYISKTYTKSTEQTSKSDNDRSSWEYDDYVRYYGVDPADYGCMWYNEIRSGPLDEFFEWAIEDISTQTNGSRLYEITDPWAANLTPDDFIGTWQTEGGILFTIKNMDGQYVIDLSENEDLGVLGGWFSQNLYNIEGDFGGMAGDYGVTSFSVFYEYGSEYPLNTWLSLSLTTSDGTEIWDVVPLISN